MRILLVDDDEQLMEVLADKLIEQHYAVDIANTGDMGWEFVLLFNYDLVVLDWMLPDIEGVELCQKIRAEGYEMPVMLLTARDRNSDKVMGLDAGADDYVVKPFNFDELTARIRALLRREIHAASPILQWQELALDPKTHEVKYQKQLLRLTPKEYVLIELFMRHPQQVFSPSAIIDSLWAGEDPPGEEAVRTHIKGLRQKLKKAGMAKDTIQTVYGVGYRLKAETKTKTPSTDQTPDKSQQIADAWLQFKDVAFQRLAILDNLASAFTENTVIPESYPEAKSAAHKLAGSLGGFGFPNGSKIAKKIEKLLENDLVEQAEIQQFTTLVTSLHDELQNQPFAAKVRAALGNNVSLLIIDRDRTYTQQLVTEASQKGMKPQATFSLDEARESILQKLPTAVLHAITFPDGADLDFLEELHQQKRQLPIVIITEDAQLSDRLEIIRKGGSLILQAPVKPSMAIDSVAELIQNSSGAAKVLIVDDDPQVLLSLEISLQPWGFDLKTLSEPQQLWDILEEFKPDLLVLDVEMPQINGLELCQLLRSDRRWQRLPILFLTVHQDEKTQHQAFAAGADDYICKPIIGSELANRILNRLQRNRILKSS
ncbi:Protein RcaC [Hyella patelloides LEGE 07179]|uniref:Protein RcaC n=1 Tax=Hyella patelloides LEGE 07179 TaxID=945734 RepID=A0A563VML3_9CYAN|nr:response regulator [Hyella patelloides]VEP12669.1 Protein RcaC [Hyella patelloides LEGE 07179]